MALQFQFDVVTAAIGPVGLLLDLWKACAVEDIQPILFQSLESFGQWLSVDQGRLSAGVDSLQDSYWQFQGLRIGLSNRGLTRIVRENNHLTAVFLFIAGCTVFNTQRVGKLIHEVMMLRRNEVFTAPQVCQFVEEIKGYRDKLPRDSPLNLYDRISQAYWSQASQLGLPIANVHDDSDLSSLAKIIHTVFDAMQDRDNERICLIGNQTGIWLCTLFSWLRPREVDIWVRDFRIYPTVDEPRTTEVQLSIILTSGPESSRSTWKVERWLRMSKVGDTVLQINTDNGLEKLKQHNTPLQGTRNQIKNTHFKSDLIVDSIGYVAGALVILASEKGEVNATSLHPQLLLSLCSPNFLSTYGKAMTWFGWQNLTQETLDHITRCFLDSMEAEYDSFTLVHSDKHCLVNLIQAALRKYEQGHGSSMLSLGGNEEDQQYAMELAIHIATEALYFSLLHKRPVNAVYRPLEPRLLHDNAQVLFSLAFGAPRMSNSGSMYKPKIDYWVFRNAAMRALLNSGESIGSSDLAVNADGYVVYQAVLGRLGETITERRVAAMICLLPGSLKLDGVAGRYRELAEQLQHALVTGRITDESDNPVELFSADKKFIGVNETSSTNTRNITVDHLIRPSDDVAGVIHIVTYLHEQEMDPVSSAPKTTSRVPASWQDSVSAVIAANHVIEGESRPMQLEMLARKWASSNRLGIRLQWRLVGRNPGPGVWNRYSSITTTSRDEALRFFEAGNLSFSGPPLIIRHPPVSLMECIKHGMDITGELSFVLIA